MNKSSWCATKLLSVKYEIEYNLNIEAQMHYMFNGVPMFRSVMNVLVTDSHSYLQSSLNEVAHALADDLLLTTGQYFHKVIC